MQHHHALLLWAFYFDEPHRRPRHRFANRLSVRRIVLLPLNVRLHVARRHQPHLMPQFAEFAPPVVGARACLDADQTAGQLRKEPQQLGSPNLPADDHAASCVYAMHLKNRFRDVQSDRDCVTHDSLLLLSKRSLSRGGGEPSTASQADIPRTLLRQNWFLVPATAFAFEGG